MSSATSGEAVFPLCCLAARIKELFRMNVHNCETLCEAVNAVNAALCADNGEELALTAFFGMFTPSTGELRYVNAGHYPPMLIGEESRYLRMKTGSPLGLYGDCNVTEEYIVLPSAAPCCFTPTEFRLRAMPKAKGSDTSDYLRGATGTGPCTRCGGDRLCGGGAVE